jgi:hypothetical protein
MICARYLYRGKSNDIVNPDYQMIFVQGQGGGVELQPLRSAGPAETSVRSSVRGAEERYRKAVLRVPAREAGAAPLGVLGCPGRHGQPLGQSRVRAVSAPLGHIWLGSTSVPLGQTQVPAMSVSLGQARVPAMSVPWVQIQEHAMHLPSGAAAHNCCDISHTAMCTSSYYPRL